MILNWKLTFIGDSDLAQSAIDHLIYGIEYEYDGGRPQLDHTFYWHTIDMDFTKYLVGFSKMFPSLKILIEEVDDYGASNWYLSNGKLSKEWIDQSKFGVAVNIANRIGIATLIKKQEEMKTKNDKNEEPK